MHHGFSCALEHGYLVVTKEGIANLGTEACNAWEQPDLRTPGEFTRGLATTVTRVGLQFKSVLGNAFSQKVSSQSVEPEGCSADLALICRVFVRLECDPVLRNGDCSKTYHSQRAIIAQLGASRFKPKAVLV